MTQTLLAVEPDSKQSAILKDIARRQLGATLVVVRSTDEAVAAIGKRIPDLILMSALVPPRDELSLNDHLRVLAGAEHVQTVSIPLLAHPAPKRARSKRFDTFRRKPGKAAEASGCDPAIFGAEIAAYLKQAADLKPAPGEVEAAPVVHDVEETPVAAVEEPVVVPVEAIEVASAVETPVVEEPIVEVVVEETVAPVVEEVAASPTVREPIALLEATLAQNSPAPAEPPPPAIADDVFREILEEMALPQRIGGGPNAEVDITQVIAADAKPTFYEELGRRRDKAAKPRGRARAERQVERIELWFALPMIPQVLLQGAVVASRPVPPPPTAAPEVQKVRSAEVPEFTGSEVPRERETQERPKVSAQPDEWGLYNPAACGFEALFDRLDELDEAQVPRVTRVPQVREERTKRAPEALEAPEAPGAPGAPETSNVTDAILQSLRLPPSIASLSAPTSCRVSKIRRLKRKASRRVPVGQRSPEPLIIVSRRMLESQGA